MKTSFAGAIRAKCLDCSGGSQGEVRHCPILMCPLWAYRFGMSPKQAVKKGKITEEELELIQLDGDAGGRK